MGWVSGPHRCGLPSLVDVQATDGGVGSVWECEGCAKRYTLERFYRYPETVGDITNWLCDGKLHIECDPT